MNGAFVLNNFFPQLLSKEQKKFTAVYLGMLWIIFFLSRYYDKRQVQWHVSDKLKTFQNDCAKISIERVIKIKCAYEELLIYEKNVKQVDHSMVF